MLPPNMFKQAQAHVSPDLHEVLQQDAVQGFFMAVASLQCHLKHCGKIAVLHKARILVLKVDLL